MAGVGCLIPFLLLLVGGGIGGAMGGTKDAIWGAAAGLLVGLLAAVVALRLFERARDGLQE